MAPRPDGTHLATCPLCEAACGIAVTVRDGAITEIRGDAQDPASRGHICPKAVALKDLHEDPDRLRRPVKRVGNEWVEISWEEAFRLTVDGIRRVQDRHGRDAVATYLGNPTVHSLGAMLFAPTFAKSLKSRNRYSATSVDQLPQHLAAQALFGHPLLVPVPDLDRTDCWIIFGANPAVSNGSMMTAPDVVKRLKAIRARGGRVIVFDPRRTETAELADEHHFVRPGTDAFVLAAMGQVICGEGLAAPAHLAPFTDGLDALATALAPFTPERAAAESGVPADVIRRIAREFATTPRAALYGRMGVNTQEFGGLCAWLIFALNVVAGHCDREGGVMFSSPAIDLVRGPVREGQEARIGRWRSRVRGLPEFSGELPVAALAEEIETEGKGQIRALITHAGNPVLSTPNGARLERAIAGLEFYAAVDFYINETTRHAQVILPPTAGLERPHYDLAFHMLAIRDTAKWAPAVLSPAPGARADWEILGELTVRLTRGVWNRLKGRVMFAVAKRIGLRGIMKRLLARSRHGAAVSMAALEAAPHGVDLGPLRSVMPARLRTANRRIQLAPSEYVADLARLASHRAPSGLTLIGRRDLRSNNSWMANSARLVRGSGRCALLMHPEDANARGLADGAKVIVSARVGAIETEVEVTDTMMSGVVALPHGWGHDREGVQLQIARAHGGVSINDLSDDQRVDAIGGNAAFSGTPVEVRAARA